MADSDRKLMYAALGVMAIMAIALVVGGSQIAGALDNLSLQGGGEEVPVSQHSVDAKVSFPTSPTNPTVVAFEEEPENWGNFVEFDLANAKQGNQAGIDYKETTSANADNDAILSDVDSGTKYVYVNADNYQPTFVQVDMPENVDKEIYVTNDNAYKLFGGEELRTTASFGSDNVVSYDNDGNVLATGTDLPTPTTNGSQTFEIVRTVDVDTGFTYLGSYDVTSFNSGDGIENVDVTITADNGEHEYTYELKDGSSGDLADSTSFGEDLADAVDTNPWMVNDRVQVTYEVTADVNTQSSSADNGQLEDGEEILTSGMEDIFGNAVSTATHTFTR